MIRSFLRWLSLPHPALDRFEVLDVDLVREYRVWLASTPTSRETLPAAMSMQSVVNGAVAGAQWLQTFRGPERAFAMGADLRGTRVHGDQPLRH